MAVMECTATDKDEMESVATPVVTVCVDNAVTPSIKMTFPVAALFEMVAVSVTEFPYTTLDDDVDSVVVVDAGVMVCVSAVDVELA